MTTSESWLMIIGMAAITYLPRFLPLGYAHRIRLPRLLNMALSYVPIAALTVIIVQTCVIRHGERAFSADNPFIWGALAAAIAAYVQKRSMVTIVSGIAVFAAVVALTR
ncbi:AzlD domain-containing protein [Aestuariibacter halophilus]|uniref:AzlD domain-containing protein n=1 Tax=Fluctibacter halophilus TaxID=226011 RepID=A0ABS8G3Y0_9ALTE|nr:AzlD domain-containing protein [Aestuariibacter halophilus]MCC2615238.1 AzlD domain-containing protein [Aestuariibacter halophilus]